MRCSPSRGLAVNSRRLGPGGRLTTSFSFTVLGHLKELFPFLIFSFPRIRHLSTCLLLFLERFIWYLTVQDLGNIRVPAGWLQAGK